MKIADHLTKAERIERTMNRHFDADDQYEMCIENCMLAGTHYLNAVLHKNGLTDEAGDLLHSDKPPLGQAVSEDVAEMMAAMKYIEVLRPRYLRGTDEWQPDEGKRCRENYQKVKSSAKRILNQ